MNIINKLTLRQLRLNKRRTLVTIIGVIISVSMVMAVSTLAASFLDLMQRDTIKKGGEWHLVYRDIDKDQLEAIGKDKETKNVIITRDRGYALLKGSKNDYKPYIFIKEYESKAFEQLPLELSGGRLPESEDEILIPDHISSNGKVEYKIGDILALEIGDRFQDGDLNIDESLKLGQSVPFRMDDEGNIGEVLKIRENKSYKIVGTIKRPDWERFSAPGYTAVSYLDGDLMGIDSGLNASVSLKRVNQNIYDHGEKLASDNNIPIASLSFNNGLLRYYGVIRNDSFRRSLYSLSGIIIALIMLGSISLIYNAFAISVSERSRYLGMLSGVGATKKQKKRSVLFEGFVIALMSIPLGLICGIAGMYITFAFINRFIPGVLGTSEKLRVIVTSSSILVASLVSALTILVSAYIPAKRASMVSAIDAIRQTPDIKLRPREVKTSRLVTVFFGVEAEIGLKNLKRNKRRYRATVVSLVISLVLFLTMSFFTNNLKKAATMTQVGINYDLCINSSDIMDDSLVNSIASLPDVTGFSRVRKLHTYSWIDKKSAADVVEAYVARIEDDRYLYGILIQALDDDNLHRFSQRVGADYDRLIDAGQTWGIVIDSGTYMDFEANRFIDSKIINLKPDQELKLINVNWETEEEEINNTVRVAALTDKIPMGVENLTLGTVNIIVSQRVMDHFIKNGQKAEFSDNLYLDSKDPIKTEADIKKLPQGGAPYIQNEYKQRQEDKQLILFLSIFIYGFISLITAISIANIFNTISTGIMLRKREFAMLKSVGMTPKSFDKMINYESIFYGFKAIVYGIPISIFIMYLIYHSIMGSFTYAFSLPWWDIIISVISIFLIVGSTMLYSGRKIKKENIMDGLRQEII